MLKAAMIELGCIKSDQWTCYCQQLPLSQVSHVNYAMRIHLTAMKTTTKIEISMTKLMPGRMSSLRECVIETTYFK